MPHLEHKKHRGAVEIILQYVKVRKNVLTLRLNLKTSPLYLFAPCEDNNNNHDLPLQLQIVCLVARTLSLFHLRFSCYYFY